MLPFIDNNNSMHRTRVRLLHHRSIANTLMSYYSLLPVTEALEQRPVYRSDQEVQEPSSPVAMTLSKGCINPLSDWRPCCRARHHTVHMHARTHGRHARTARTHACMQCACRWMHAPAQLASRCISAADDYQPSSHVSTHAANCLYVRTNEPYVQMYTHLYLSPQ